MEWDLHYLNTTYAKQKDIECYNIEAEERRKKKRRLKKLCREDQCDISSCDEEPCHCETGLEILQAKADMRAELMREG